MTETPMDGTPPRNGPDARDWFAPPAEQPSDITYSGPLPAPIPTAPPSIPIPGTLKPPTDLRVWPPLEPEGPEGEDRSTQPFPALRTNRQPPPGALAPAPPSAEPPAEPPRVPPAEVPAEVSAGVSAVEPTAPRRRTGLLVGGTVLSVVLAVGGPTVFGYQAYKYGRPDDIVHTVQPGQAGVWQHVSWRATVEKIKDPTGKPERSDRQWLKIVITRTALDAEGAIRHGAPAEVKFTDRAGRTWQVELVNDETPPDVKDNKIGTPYRLEMMGVVPPPVADEVEVALRPSTYRDVPDQSAEDFVKDAFTNPEKNDDVLRFRR
ncbi:hypothetical protein [Microbispora hainanensis]|uniref:Uncharacterized protein n=1 Tax=Microbispora hainanensis TaxID=568844 RepID=A0A544YHT0_9ACTN|nr:hypothetical protein [Microbispora hainanensis]TQS16052.1 hypothetical protein FLX08_32415 [Microbispora hainanensis]